jgi:hypothetical protein
MSRRWYAEDVASAMEARAGGAPVWAIAIAFSSTQDAVHKFLADARRLGIARYPMRTPRTMTERVLA